MPRIKISKSSKVILLLLAVLVAGFFLRALLARYYTAESGDLLLYADWAEKYWLYGSQNFYTYPVWYYAPPNYPPLLSLIYASAYWLYEHKYYLAELHNIIKIPPAFFIIYFYEFGLYLLLKLPGILADIGLGIIIFQLVKKISGDVKKAFFAAAFYIFNPVSVFLSGVWGQTDSLVSLFALSSFIALWAGKAWLSIPLLFLSFYIKPNWGIFIPLYLFLFILKKPQVKQIISGVLVSGLLFLLATLPFTEGNLISFSKWLWSERLLPTATIAHRASVSAFNFHSIFLTINKHLDFHPYLGISANYLGFALFTFVNLISFRYIKRQKASLSSIVVGIFSIGFGGYLFLTNMLERYFFHSFVPMIILMFTTPRLLVYGILINLSVFANIIYSFFRRSWGELADFFGANNFLLVRAFSLINLIFFLLTLKTLKFFKR